MASEYINGQLDADVARALEYHLTTCSTCPPLYVSLVALRQRLAESKEGEPRQQVRARILERVQRALTERH